MWTNLENNTFYAMLISDTQRVIVIILPLFTFKQGGFREFILK